MIWRFGRACYRSFDAYRQAVLDAIALDVEPGWLWQRTTRRLPRISYTTRPIVALESEDMNHDYEERHRARRRAHQKRNNQRPTQKLPIRKQLIEYL
jgi:hypothetical protein